MKRTLATLFTVALVFRGGAAVRADVGQSLKAAVAAVSVRAPWSHVKPVIGGVGGDPGYLWEHDAEPEERRFAISTVRGRSNEESYERSTRLPSYGLGPGDKNDLKPTLSAATFADFTAATQIGVVSSPPLQLTQTYYRGRVWGYIVGRGTVAVHGSRNYTWTQVLRADLANRLRASRACAKTGECAE